jgi:integrase
MLQRNPVRAAQLHEIALALDILLKDPIRRGTLAAINIVEHVRRTSEGRITGLFIPGRESKNGIPIETFFDPVLAERFERHLTTFRCHIRGASGPFLFPSPDCGPRNAANLAKRLKRTVEDELGVSFNVHLVRHIAATIIFEADPKNAPLAQRLLRHTSLAQTETMYGERRSRSAQAQWSAIIENELRSKRPT